MARTTILIWTTLGLCLSSAPARVRAHISLERGATHLSRYGENSLKQGPCGKAGGARGTHVYRYRPGDTISIEVVEFIPHPGHFRISFDDDGDDAFVDPSTAEEFNSNAAVLQDNLFPHTGGSGQPRYTFTVSLPDIECERCTLQIVQVMTDKAPYAPGTDDLYYQCIDLVLSESASIAGSGGSSPAEGAGAGGAAPTMAAGDGGSCTAASPGRVRAHSGALSSCAALGLLLAFRRQRKAVLQRKRV